MSGDFVGSLHAVRGLMSGRELNSRLIVNDLEEFSSPYNLYMDVYA